MNTYLNDCGVPKPNNCCCCNSHSWKSHCPVILECGEPILLECCDEVIKLECCN